MTLAARVAETGNRNRLLFDPTDSLLSSVWPTFPPQNVVVAICRNLPCDFVADIMALDGQVAGLLLLAPSLPATTVIDLMVQVGATILRTDRADLTALNVPHARPAVMAAATAWYLTTSGTIGIPKIVRHTLANLTRSVQASNKDEPPRWGLLYESSRFAGLQVVL